MSLVGGVIIFASSLLFTTILFPQYFDELRAIQSQMLKQAGQSDAQIKAVLDAGAATATPFYQALFGFIGTVVTGVVVSSVAGAFLRKK
jgi:Zn-dependent membrane protease YugP